MSRRVQFECHSPSWRLVENFSIQPCYSCSQTKGLLSKVIVASCSFGNKTGKNESRRFVKVKLPQLGIAKLFVIFLRGQLELICSLLVFKAITDLRKLIIIHRVKKRKKKIKGYRYF